VKTVALIISGALGALGILRGLEIIFVTGEIVRAMLPLALGMMFTLLFIKERKNAAPGLNKTRKDA
jgi:hypothetical protein